MTRLTRQQQELIVACCIGLGVLAALTIPFRSAWRRASERIAHERLPTTRVYRPMDAALDEVNELFNTGANEAEGFRPIECRTGALATAMAHYVFNLADDPPRLARDTRTDVCAAYCDSRPDRLCTSTKSSSLVVANPDSIVYICTATYRKASDQDAAGAFGTILRDFGTLMSPAAYAVLPISESGHVWKVGSQTILLQQRGDGSDVFDLLVRTDRPDTPEMQKDSYERAAKVLGEAIRLLGAPKNHADAVPQTTSLSQTKSWLDIAGIAGNGLIVIGTVLLFLSYVLPAAVRSTAEEMWYTLASAPLLVLVQSALQRAAARVRENVQRSRTRAWCSIALLAFVFAVALVSLSFEAFAYWSDTGYYFIGKGIAAVQRIIGTDPCLPCGALRPLYWRLIVGCLIFELASIWAAWLVVSSSSAMRDWPSAAIAVGLQMVIVACSFVFNAVVVAAWPTWESAENVMVEMLSLPVGPRGQIAQLLTISLGAALPIIVASSVTVTIVMLRWMPSSAQRGLEEIVFRVATSDQPGLRMVGAGAIYTGGFITALVGVLTALTANP